MTDTLCGVPIAVILKPGDTVVLEAQSPMPYDKHVAIMKMLEDASTRLGIKALLLPHDVKVARVEVPHGIDTSHLEKGHGEG